MGRFANVFGPPAPATSVPHRFDEGLAVSDPLPPAGDAGR